MKLVIMQHCTASSSIFPLILLGTVLKHSQNMIFP